MRARSLVAGVAAVLAGCSSGGGDGGGAGGVAAACDYIYGGGTTTLATPACATCTVENEAAAIDGNPDTYAAIRFPAGGSGDMALRATAQSGVVYPANSHPGAIISVASGPTYAESGIALRTYYQGVLVSTNQLGSINGVGGGNSSPQKYNATTFTQFDAVEVAYSRGAGISDTEIRIHEFCSN